MALDVTGVGTAVNGVKDILGMFFPNKTEEEKAQIAAALTLIKAQTDANTAEAAQPGVHFRDGAGWVCVFSFGVLTLKPLIEWGCALAHNPVTLPPIDTSMTYPMLMALLGLGGMHAGVQILGQK